MYSCAKLIIIAGPRKENLSFLQRVVVTHVQVPEDVLYTPVLLGLKMGVPLLFHSTSTTSCSTLQLWLLLKVSLRFATDENISSFVQICGVHFPLPQKCLELQRTKSSYTDKHFPLPIHLYPEDWEKKNPA